MAVQSSPSASLAALPLVPAPRLYSRLHRDGLHSAYAK